MAVRLQGRRNPYVAREGIPFLLASLGLAWLAWWYLPVAFVAIPLALTVVLFLVFRDPLRTVPPSALGVVSPVDGIVIEVETVETGAPQGAAHRVSIEVDAMGTYTARSPAEGSVVDLASANPEARSGFRGKCLWIRTDEGDDVVMAFRGFRLGLAPKAFVRYGERLGQGQRSAYLRLVRHVDVYLPIDGKTAVTPGTRVVGGSDLIGSVPHH